MAMLIPADICQPQREVHPRHHHFTLDELRSLLSCDWIEILETNDGRLMICDEESKLSADHQRNQRASEFMVFVSLREVKAQIDEARRQGYIIIHDYDFTGDLDSPADYIAGNCLLCNRNEVK